MRCSVAGLLVGAVLGAVSGCAAWTKTASPPEDDLGLVGDFSLTERSGGTVKRADLLGKVWVASFIFTRCSTSCPLICKNLAQLQQDLADQDDVVLVSFTVDPDHDTPEVLRAYADSFGADPKRWLFLTGKQEDIYTLVEKSFKLSVKQNEDKARTSGNEVTHSNRLILVDRKGRIRAWDFDGTIPDDLARVRKKIQELLRETP